MPVFFQLIIFLTLFSCQGEAPQNLGVNLDKNALSACPTSPNCIVSFAYDEKHFSEPFHLKVPNELAKESILKILQTENGVKIIKNEGNYLRAEFTTSLLRFIDDVEFYFGEKEKIHFRSASRIGHSDLGANKKRIERIKFRFYQNDF